MTTTRPGFVTPDPPPPRTDPLLILRTLATGRYHILLPESEARILAEYVYKLQRENASLRELAVEGARAEEGR